MAIRASMIERQSVRNVIDSFDPISNPIRMGVVGLGHRSFHNVVKTLPHYEDYMLTALCDIKPEVVERVQHLVKDEFSLDIPGYTDFDEMLKNESLDAVAIQIDPDKQVALAVKAMNAGCHVMIEVPTTYSIDECWDLVVTHERTGKVCLLMEQVRYSGYIRGFYIGIPFDWIFKIGNLSLW